jgi:NAD(P)-dependent dehydrogenase (short-subunit alcohol dehydrogenase family)
MRLKNKIALITGSSRGMGKATALIFAKERAKVIVNYLESKNVKKLNFDCEYEMEGNEYLEYCYLSKVVKSDIKLSIEHIDYKWLELKDFIEELYWLGNKQEVYKELVSKSMI